jgi:hypothetical protein
MGLYLQKHRISSVAYALLIALIDLAILKGVQLVLKDILFLEALIGILFTIRELLGQSGLLSDTSVMHNVLILIQMRTWSGCPIQTILRSIMKMLSKTSEVVNESYF